MAEKKVNLKADVAKRFQSTLNIHGYPFQYRVLKAAEQACSKSRSPLRKPISEFPVEVQGYSTKIDFILQYKERRKYLLAECKRANPAYSDWCFVKAPYLDVESIYPNQIFVEHIQKKDDGSLTSTLKRVTSDKNICHISIELKTNQRGDPVYSKSEIEKALTQVCRGLNGLINLCGKNDDVLPRKAMISFLQVIFTTANLYISEVDLSTADIETGKIEIPESSISEKEWVFLHYHQSPTLKFYPIPTIDRNILIGEDQKFPYGDNFDIHFNEEGLSSVLYNEYVRTIAIVNSKNIEKFLKFRTPYPPENEMRPSLLLWAG